MNRLNLAEEIVGQVAARALQRRNRVEHGGKDDGLHDVLGGTGHCSTVPLLVIAQGARLPSNPLATNAPTNGFAPLAMTMGGEVDRFAPPP
jgi:hypothetical protein